MINQKQRLRMVRKLQRLCTMADSLFFSSRATLEVSIHETEQRLFEIPAANKYHPIASGQTWGKASSFAWFKGSVCIDEKLANKPLFVRPKLGGYEGLLYVNGVPTGAFAEKIVVTSHGNHYSCCIASSPMLGAQYDIDIEYYAGHPVPGTQPFDGGNGSCFAYAFEHIELCHKNQLAIDFAIDLRTLLEIFQLADGHAYRKEEIYYLLEALNVDAIYSQNDLDDPSIWQPFFEMAIQKMRPLLAKDACESDGHLALYGHSHMDTAWLWQRSETIKKCARTAANAINYMQQYPEYCFLQSSIYHYKQIKTYYPSLFIKIKEMVSAGRYDPNGGCFIECDCNITSGESMVRHFLWAQRFTRKEFNYTADCFWLPDTFGYAASIPQIMKGCGLQHFLTTKLSWNDTNQFPYESFLWKGIDGTTVTTHFNITQDGPYPAQTIASLRPKDGLYKTGERFYAFGEGDGGGGPEFCMIEAARRSSNVLGAPKCDYESVSSFMNRLSQNKHLPTYKGELYLELHRATLTNQPFIKRNNRKAELLHRNVELVTCMQAIARHVDADITLCNSILETILINQFHDILPGTCIEAAHKDCYADMHQVLISLQNEMHAILGKADAERLAITVFNPLCNQRNDAFLLTLPNGKVPSCSNWQIIERGEKDSKVLVSQLSVAPLGFAVIPLQIHDEKPLANSPFIKCKNTLDTPYYKVQFDEYGYISSLFDKHNNRYISCDNARSLGTLLYCENVPAMWDSWDIDADAQMRFKCCYKVVSSKIVSQGSVAYIIENSYQISEQTIAIVRTTFYAHQPNINYETIIDTKEVNQFICVVFDTSLRTTTARFDIQYGNVQRAVHQNTCVEQATFEVCHHKYCDLSQQGYGVALLNDCKYGVHTTDSSIRLSLHYGAQHPDASASMGRHYMTYSLLPHKDSFCASNVVLPAYCLNQPVIECANEASKLPSLIAIDCSNIILEAMKPCEDTQKAIIIRLYECEGRQSNCTITLHDTFKAAAIANMLEEPLQRLHLSQNSFSLSFNPFEIVTIKLEY